MSPKKDDKKKKKSIPKKDIIKLVKDVEYLDLGEPHGESARRYLAFQLSKLIDREEISGTVITPEGVYISYFTGLTHEGTKPEIRILDTLPMTLMGYDTNYYQGFIAESMIRIGFKTVRSRTLNTPWGPMELDIGKK